MDVYCMNFSDGRFYIGYTVNIKQRMASHFHDTLYQDRYQAIRRDFKDLDDFTKSIQILYSGFDSIFHEKRIIYENKDNKLMMNRRIPKYRPDYNQWLDMGTYTTYGELVLSNAAGLMMEFIARKQGKITNDIVSEFINSNHELLMEKYNKVSEDNTKGVK